MTALVGPFWDHKKKIDLFSVLKMNDFLTTQVLFFDKIFKTIGDKTLNGLCVVQMRMYTRAGYVILGVKKWFLISPANRKHLNLCGI